MYLLRRFLAVLRVALTVFHVVWGKVSMLTNLPQLIILNMGTTNVIFSRVVMFSVAQEYKHLKSLLLYVFGEI